MNLLNKVALWVACCAVGALLGFMILSSIYPLPPAKPYSVMLEDRQGRFIHAFIARDGIWRLQTSPTEIPAKLKHLLVRKEDRFFWYHPGVNPVSILRAVLQNLITGRRVSGASTITMQVARMLEPKERTYTNKLFEIFRAVQLECRYSKDEILEMYLSMIPLGGNIEGLKSAALLYYQTPPERLNIAQLFDLILIPNDPNDLRPDRNAAKLFEERKRRALPWIRLGVLSRQDSEIIWQTPPASGRFGLPRLASHFSLRVLEKSGGASELRTSLDLRIQQTSERLLSNHLRQWRQKGVRNGAVLILQNRTREVAAYVGSEDFNDAEARGQVDAVKAVRSPGSTLKPFLFAMEMDRGVLTPKTRLLDTPYDMEGFAAENYDGRYSGLVYADEALRRSLNVPAIRLLRESGVRQFVSSLRQAGFSSLDAQQDRLGLSMIVGGCGVTLEELVAAYSTFPAGGVYAPPVYLRQADPVKGHQAFSASAAFMVTEILSSLDRPDLPNNFESSANLPKVAFKTGTSYGRRDAWAIGFSAEYTVGVWLGNVDQRGCPDLTGGKAAAPLLIDIFNSISTAALKTILPRPGDVLDREVCAVSGLVPTKYCPHTTMDEYSVRHSLDRFCDIHREFLVSTDGKQHYCPSCLGNHAYRLKVFEEYPPELLSFWTSIGRSYQLIPPHNPGCTRLFTGDGPKIVSPSDAMTYYVFSADQKISLQANSGIDVADQSWYVDRRFIFRKKANEKQFVALAEGPHEVTCVDDRGRLVSVRITVKTIN